MLLGRDREQRAILRLLAEASAGSSGVVALVGEAGIGKSSLLEWTASRAEGMNVLRARGVQSEAQIPFASLFELLRPAFPSLDSLPAPQRDALESALALRPAEAHDRLAVGAATLSLLAAHAEAAPLALLIDDAQWLDGSSADALRFALRRLVADPVAVVLTVRHPEPSLLDDADLPTLRLHGLDADATADLLQREAPGTTLDAAARLHRETGGNPLALLELAGEPAPDTPLDTPVATVTSVAAAYLQRAQALPERTFEILVLAAAYDHGDLAVLVGAADSLGLGVSDLAPAEERELINVRSGGFEFRHPLARSAIYGGASAAQRRSAHRALADVLPDSEADRRAWHLALAVVGPDDTASRALEGAAQRARNRSAYDVASRAYERAALLALDGHSRGRLAYAAAEAGWLGGLAQRAQAMLDLASHNTVDEQVSTEVEHLRGHIALRRGPLEQAREVLLVAAERAAAHAPEEAVVMLAEAAEGAFYAGDAAGMLACGEQASALATRAPGGRAAFFAQITAGMARVLAGEADGAGMIRDAVALLERSNGLGDDPRLLAWAAMGPLWLREAGTGERLIERAVELARTRSAAGALPHLLTHIGIAEGAADRFLPALATFDEAVRLARETGQRTILAGALARLARVEARCGREQASREHAGEALAHARDLGAHLFEIWALIALGELELARGDAQAALARFAELRATLDQNRISDPDLSPAPELVELYLRTGRRDPAAHVVDPFLAAATAKGQPWALARAARCRALLADEPNFADEFEHALAIHARTPDAFETARSQLAYGARLRRAGQRVRAREQLRSALRTFDDLGALPWAEFARVELAGTGETARRRDPSTLDDLTAQELRISLLLAGGKTTREAAATLFLSPKTIEYHLRNVYRKLGVRTRSELADALARER
ncbi:MAG: ATP-binding protein [Solirubrobacteraceae bacterium]